MDRSDLAGRSDIIPILVIYRKYYGTKMMLTLLGISYATRVTGGHL